MNGGGRSLPDDWLMPEWPAPGRVRACTTTRACGVSTPPYSSMNPADHVGDDPLSVRTNRRLLRERLSLPAEPCWLQQVHGTRVVEATQTAGRPERADASTTSRHGVVCAVLTADCLPVLLCNRDGSRIAAVHAGWRGLATGVLEAAVDVFGADRGKVMAWLGPAIGPEAFEVGADVYAAFTSTQPDTARAFTAVTQGRWLADIYRLARYRLSARGVESIHGGGWCTSRDKEQFFSYRRDGVTGRMATLIWLE